MSLLARVISILMIAIMLLVAALDLSFHLRKLPPVGERLHRWALHYPVYASVIALLLGALLGHFFWQ
jgi:hypothetical protein